MSFRDSTDDLSARIAEIERRLRAVEQPGCCPPDRGWVLTSIDSGSGPELHYLYVPTGSLGPVVGTQ